MANISVPKAGGSIRVTGVSVPTAHTISIGELPFYATSAASGSDKIITLPENTYEGRSFTLTATGVTSSHPDYQGTATITSSWTISQLGNFVKVTANSPVSYSATSLPYQVSASTDCRVRLTGTLIPTFIQNDHTSGLSAGSFTIPTNPNNYEVYYTLSIWSLVNVSVTGGTSVTQGASSRYVTGITLSDVTQTTYVSATGGTATYNNYSYVVTLKYNDGTTADITSTADMSGSSSLSLPATTEMSAHTAGTINIIAAYTDGPNTFTSTSTQYVWQNGLDSIYTWSITNMSPTYAFYCGGITGTSQTFGFDLHPNETKYFTDPLPFTITEMAGGLSGGKTDGQIIISNSTGGALILTYQTLGGENAWIGQGSLLVNSNARDLTLTIN